MSSSPSTRRSTYSPSEASRRLVDAFHNNFGLLGNTSSFHNSFSYDDGSRRSSSRRASLTSPSQIQAIVDDPIQFRLLQDAMRKRRSCTSMGLKELHLPSLIQDRIMDMEDGSRRQSINASPPIAKGRCNT